jgi:hypothetical protein
MKSPDGILQLDSCGLIDGSYHLCYQCDALDDNKISKFSALNGVNVTMCQDCPAELKDLTLVEQYTIAMSHPTGSILKLRLNGKLNPAAYNGIRGPATESWSLLDILPSPQLQFHDYIKVVWQGKTEPTVDDLKPFMEVRKKKLPAPYCGYASITLYINRLRSITN